MLVVGLTGNIASGKSEVARRLARLGATVIDADILAREAVAPGTPALAEIVAHWGPSVLRADGSLDRDALRRVVFRTAQEREALNGIVHPRVEALRRAALEEARRRGDRIVVCDIPLLYELGLESRVDCVILVDAPEEIRMARLRRHRGLDDGEARRMIAAQMPAAAKRSRADYVMDNDGSLELLDGRVADLWSALQRRVR